MPRYETIFRIHEETGICLPDFLLSGLEHKVDKAFDCFLLKGGGGRQVMNFECGNAGE